MKSKSRPTLAEFMSKYPPVNMDIISFSRDFADRNKRAPSVRELPPRLQIALGRTVFDYCKYRDEHRKGMCDQLVYEGCLCDHGVERDFPDGQDYAIDRDHTLEFIAKLSPAPLKREDFFHDGMCWRIK